MVSFTSPCWLGSLWLLTGTTLPFLSVVSVPICQSRTAGSPSLARSPQSSPTGYLETEPFVAGSHSIAAATFVQESSSRAIFQHSLWLSLLLRNMRLQLLHVQDLCEEHFIPPFTFPQSAHLHKHFFHVSQVRPVSLPALAAQTSLWSTGTSAFSSEFQIWPLDLWCSRGDCLSVSRLCCCMSLPSLCWLQQSCTVLSSTSGQHEQAFPCQLPCSCCTPCSQSSWQLTHPECPACQWSRNPGASLLHFLARSPGQVTFHTGFRSSSLTSWMSVVPGTHHNTMYWWLNH